MRGKLHINLGRPITDLPGSSVTDHLEVNQEREVK